MIKGNTFTRPTILLYSYQSLNNLALELPIYPKWLTFITLTLVSIIICFVEVNRETIKRLLGIKRVILHWRNWNLTLFENNVDVIRVHRVTFDLSLYLYRSLLIVIKWRTKIYPILTHINEFQYSNVTFCHNLFVLFLFLYNILSKPCSPKSKSQTTSLNIF